MKNRGLSERLKTEYYKDYLEKLEKIPVKVKWNDDAKRILEIWKGRQLGVLDCKSSMYGDAITYLVLYLRKHETFKKDVELFLEYIKEVFKEYDMPNRTVYSGYVDITVYTNKIWVGDISFYVPNRGSCRIVTVTGQTETIKERILICD